MRKLLVLRAAAPIVGIALGLLLWQSIRPAHADSPEDRYLERIARAVEKIADRADRCK